MASSPYNKKTLFPCLIRLATFQDIEGLSHLLDQLGYPISKEELKSNLELYQQSCYQQVFVADYQGQPIGCLALHLMDLFHYKGRLARIVALIVDQAFRRKGIASQLIEKAELYAKENECSIIELTSGQYRKELGSHQFYYAKGYTDQHNKLYLRKELI